MNANVHSNTAENISIHDLSRSTVLSLSHSENMNAV